MAERMLVIGGDAAGMSAASQARRRTERDDLEIVVCEKGQYTSYSACGLPYLVGGLVADPQDLIARSPEQHRANGIDVRLGYEVLAIDLDRRAVRVRATDESSGHTAEHDEPFDQLVIATGAVPIRPDLPGSDARGIHGIQTITDGIALCDHLDAKRDDDEHRRAVVVGGGYIGLEMAEAMRHRGLDVVLVERSSQTMGSLDDDMAAMVTTALEGLGIDVRLETEVLGFEQDEDGNVRAVRTSGGTLPADVVVLGLGVRPNSGLAANAGIDVGASGGIVTDRRMATSADGVWAAGDCVESFHRISGRKVVFALGTHANRQGKVVGVNATGGYAAFAGVIGTAVTKVCEFEVARTGLGEREAAEAGFEITTTRIESTSRAGYYPDAQPLHVKVHTDARTGRLLGAQIVGREGAAKRIDVLAAAIWNEMTAEEFGEVDLGYAPPYSPLWDPTVLAARKAAGTWR